MLKSESKVFFVEEVKEEELYSWINQHLPEGSYVYAVLDNTIVLGIFKSESITAGNAREETIDSLPVELIRELRVFHEYGEVKAVRRKNNFMVRFIEDKDEDTRWITTQETQKIWGKTKRKCKVPGWCLLESDRGSKILLPQTSEVDEEKGLVVKKYYQLFPKENRELFRLVEERLCGYTEWNSKKGAMEHGENNEQLERDKKSIYQSI